MSVNWNEVRGRANKFINRWKVAVSESSDSQSFWVEFFGIFEIDFVEDDSLMFEKAVPKSDGHIGHWETRRLGVENLWMLNKKKM